MKKAQTEVIGLAFLVIIAVFGLIIYISLSSSVESTNTLRQRELAASMITTMIQVDVDSIKYQDLVALCVARNERCDELKEISNQMLSEFHNLNQDYAFTIEGPDGVTEITLPESGTPGADYACGVTRKAVATQPISLYGTSDKAVIMLALC